MDQFCHSVSHDLKSPIQVIKQLADLLREELSCIPGGINGDLEAILSRLDGKCLQTEAMIGRLLEFSHMITLNYHPESLNAAGIVREVFEELSGLEPERDIILTMDQTSAPLIDGDFTLLRLLFQNILGNAIKFTRGRKHAQISFSSRQTPSRIIIELKDNGTGFDMDNSGRLFQVFERLHTQEEFEGSGVGLAISKRIMEKHKGTISICGIPDKGTTVTLCFPASLPPDVS